MLLDHLATLLRVPFARFSCRAAHQAQQFDGRVWTMGARTSAVLRKDGVRSV